MLLALSTKGMALSDTRDIVRPGELRLLTALFFELDVFIAINLALALFKIAVRVITAGVDLALAFLDKLWIGRFLTDDTALVDTPSRTFGFFAFEILSPKVVDLWSRREGFR